MEHLKHISKEDRETNISKAKELSQQGMSQRKIAKELGISLGAVNKYLKIYSISLIFSIYDVYVCIKT